MNRRVVKWVYLLLSWPVGIYVISSVLQSGLQQKPYALAVHEMLILVLFVFLIVSSTLHAMKSGSLGWSTIGKVWQMIKLMLSAGLSWLFLIAPSFYLEAVNQPCSGTVMTALLVLVLGFGIVSLSRIDLE